MREILGAQKDTEFAKKRQKFSIEMSFIESIFGQRYRGSMNISDRGITPVLKLEAIAPDRLKILRDNLRGFDVAEIEKMGITDVWISKKREYPQWLLSLTSKGAQKAMSKEYEDAVLRNRLLYFTYIGEQNGEIVPGVDVRELTKQEEQGLYAKRKKQGNNVIWRSDDEAMNI